LGKKSAYKLRTLGGECLFVDAFVWLILQWIFYFKLQRWSLWN